MTLTAEVVCGNPRNRRWNQLLKQGGFRTTGDSHVCPYYLYNLVHSPPCCCIKVFFLSDEGTIRKEDQGQGEEETLIC